MSFKLRWLDCVFLPHLAALVVLVLHLRRLLLLLLLFRVRADDVSLAELSAIFHKATRLDKTAFTLNDAKDYVKESGKERVLCERKGERQRVKRAKMERGC